MKIRTVFSAVAVLLLSTSLGSLSSCSKKTGADLAEKTTTSMQTVQGDVSQAKSQVDITNGSLNNVISVGSALSVPPEDVKQAFNAYSTNVKKMEDIANRLNKDITDMDNQANRYFQQWSEQGQSFTNPDLQQYSQEQRGRMRDSFNNLTSTSAGLRGSLNAYLSEIKQIQAYLSNDLTPTGISKITSIAQSAARDGEKLKSSFDPVQMAISDTIAVMKPGGGAATGGTPPPSSSTPPSSSPGIGTGPSDSGSPLGSGSLPDDSVTGSSSPTKKTL